MITTRCLNPISVPLESRNFLIDSLEISRIRYCLITRFTSLSKTNIRLGKKKRFGVLKIHNVSAIRHFTIELAKYFKDIETSADWDQLLFTIL